MNENFDVSKRMYNSSSLADYMGCPRLFYWAWIHKGGLVPLGPRSALDFGSAFHEALLVWYRKGTVEEAVAKFNTLPAALEDDIRTRGWGETIFKKYIEQYPDEAGRTLHLEVKFRVEIGERIYSGTMDRIEKWNGIYVTDHKTTARLGLSFFETYRPHPQIDGYVWACRDLLGECNGAILNGISTAANPKERFQRFISSRTPDEIDQWPTIFSDTVDDIERDVERKHFRQCTTHCHKWGKCKFWELCVYHQKDEMREKYIEGAFTTRPEELEREKAKEAKETQHQ